MLGVDLNRIHKRFKKLKIREIYVQTTCLKLAQPEMGKPQVIDHKEKFEFICLIQFFYYIFVYVIYLYWIFSVWVFELGVKFVSKRFT